jgi:trk system potassium uptake protein TrkA
VAALVNEPSFVKLAPTLGVDICISPRLATAAAILQYVRVGEVHSLAMVEQGGSEVLELSVPKGSRVAGRSLAELHVPAGSIIGVIVRGEKVLVAGGADRLEAGDHVIVFTLPEAVPDVEKFFLAP